MRLKKKKKVETRDEVFLLISTTFLSRFLEPRLHCPLFWPLIILSDARRDHWIPLE